VNVAAFLGLVDVAGADVGEALDAGHCGACVGALDAGPFDEVTGPSYADEQSERVVLDELEVDVADFLLERLVDDTVEPGDCGFRHRSPAVALVRAAVGCGCRCEAVSCMMRHLLS
jgi:hypothetical protein